MRGAVVSALQASHGLHQHARVFYDAEPEAHRMLTIYIKQRQDVSRVAKGLMIRGLLT